MALYSAFLHRMDVVNQHWTLYQFTLPYQFPLKDRKGLIVKLDLSDGSSRWGEISPLTGRSKETLSLAKKQAIADLTKLSKRRVLYPSVACGLGHARKTYCADTKPIPLCALLCGTRSEILEKAAIVYAQGYRTVKVKVSSLSFADAYHVLNELITQFNVRIDVNLAWSFGESLSFFSRFDPNAFEYIEDPIHELEKLHQFTHPFALDESLKHLNHEGLVSLSKLKALIIKPTLIGGIQECLKFKALAEELNVKLIISSAWESGIGIIQLASLAKALGTTEHPLGLDTYRFLTKDLLCDPLDFSKPELILPSSFAVNMHLLEEVARG